MGVRIRFVKHPDFGKFEIKTEVDRIMKAIVIDAIAEIKTRTISQGIDADGAPFEPYSRGYQKVKNQRASGLRGRRGGLRKRETKGIGYFQKPNLVLSGHMMKAIVGTAYRSGTKLIGRIFLNSSGEAIKVVGNMRHRKFFLLADRQVKDFRARMFSILRKK